MSRTVTIEVPASTSNLGAGFDCVGVAVSLWLRVDATLLGPGAGAVELRREGTLASLGVSPAEDRIVRGFQAACAAAGASRAGVAIEARSEIPVGRGLGSSAAATVAGALAANALLGLGLDAAALLDVCAALEGHADNAAAALEGGAVLVAQQSRGRVVTPLEVHPDLAFVFAVPPFAVHTESARSILPRTVAHRVAATAAAHAAALVHGLAHADENLLAVALDDVLHVPFRRRLVPGYEEIAAAACAAGACGATLSGSGSAILAVARLRHASAVGDAMADAWRRLGVAADILHPTIVRELACR